MPSRPTRRPRQHPARTALGWAVLLGVGLLALHACRPNDRPATTGKAAPPRPSPKASPAPATRADGPPVEAVTFRGKRFTVCTVDLSLYPVTLHWRDASGEPYNTFTNLAAAEKRAGRRLVFAMNAGMFREDFSPVGLYVENGKQLRKLNRARGSGNFCMRPNGVFCVTRDGARVVETSAYPSVASSVRYASQSGPMLVIRGGLHPSFGPNSTSRLIRNGVGVVSRRKVVFAIAEDPVNFHEFACLFRDHLQCDNALYFDGSVSGLYSTALGRDDSWTFVGPMVAVSLPD